MQFGDPTKLHRKSGFGLHQLRNRSRKSGFGAHGSNLSSGFHNYRRLTRGDAVEAAYEGRPSRGMLERLLASRKFCLLSDFCRMHITEAQA